MEASTSAEVVGVGGLPTGCGGGGDHRAVEAGDLLGGSAGLEEQELLGVLDGRLQISGGDEGGDLAGCGGQGGSGEGARWRGKERRRHAITTASAAEAVCSADPEFGTGLHRFSRFVVVRCRDFYAPAK
jgi:hypothetical protein